jgi:hypothetical protein
VLYFTQMDHALSSVRVVIDVPTGLGRATRKHRGVAATYDPARGDGWVTFAPNGVSAAVSYNVAEGGEGVKAHMHKSVQERLRR